ncbi:MAG TPA: hypothetical protein VK588_15270 [Chitinophagaceae bacterium]|nr:hypothetical protein [Chitinophagaceae bacterium]
MKGMAAGKCHGKMEHQKKLPGKCSSTADCSVCPVCSVFTFLHQYEWSSKYTTSGKNYFFVNSGYASSYIPTPWKPPNG